MSLVTFRELLEDAFLSPERVDYGLLRTLYVESGEHRPLSVDLALLDQLNRHLSDAEWEEAVAAAEALIEVDPLSVGLRLAYGRALDGLGDDWEAATQRSVANGLIRAILCSGDGRSPDTALWVLDDRERQIALDRLGVRAVRATREQVGERWFDVVRCDDGRTLWFDVASAPDWTAGRRSD